MFQTDIVSFLVRILTDGYYTVSITSQPIPVAALSKANVCDCSLAGFAGSNPTGGTAVWFLCVVRWGSLQRADPSLTGVLPSVCVYVCVCVCVCVCVSHWVWSGATVTLFTLSESVEEIRLRKTERKKERKNNYLIAAFEASLLTHRTPSLKVRYWE
jgi:hypothetical protein